MGVPARSPPNSPGGTGVDCACAADGASPTQPSAPAATAVAKTFIGFLPSSSETPEKRRCARKCTGPPERPGPRRAGRSAGPRRVPAPVALPDLAKREVLQLEARIVREQPPVVGGGQPDACAAF